MRMCGCVEVWKSIVFTLSAPCRSTLAPQSGCGALCGVCVGAGKILVEMWKLDYVRSRGLVDQQSLHKALCGTLGVCSRGIEAREGFSVKLHKRHLCYTPGREEQQSLHKALLWNFCGGHSIHTSIFHTSTRSHLSTHWHFADGPEFFVLRTIKKHRPIMYTTLQNFDAAQTTTMDTALQNFDVAQLFILEPQHSSRGPKTARLTMSGRIPSFIVKEDMQAPFGASSFDKDPANSRLSMAFRGETLTKLGENLEEWAVQQLSKTPEKYFGKSMSEADIRGCLCSNVKRKEGYPALVRAKCNTGAVDNPIRCWDERGSEIPLPTSWKHLTVTSAQFFPVKLWFMSGRWGLVLEVRDVQVAQQCETRQCPF